MPPPPALRLAFGGFRAGAGFPVGASYVTGAGPHALWTTGVGWSVHNFKRADTALVVPGIFGGRAQVRATAARTDEPTLKFFGVGMSSLESDEVNYGLRSTDAGLAIDARAGRWFLAPVFLRFIELRPLRRSPALYRSSRRRTSRGPGPSSSRGSSSGSASSR